LRILKKSIVKEDGRALIYYHFPQSCSASQKEAFENVDMVAVELDIDSAQSSSSRTNLAGKASV
jgi:hypothetical protein